MDTHQDHQIYPMAADRILRPLPHRARMAQEIIAVAATDTTGSGNYTSTAYYVDTNTADTSSLTHSNISDIWDEEDYDAEEDEEDDDVEEDDEEDDVSNEDDDTEDCESDESKDDTESDSVHWDSDGTEDGDMDADNPESEASALQSLHPRLREHYGILPPHVFQRARAEKSHRCDGKVGNLILIVTHVISGGNGATTLRLVYVIEENAGGVEKTTPFEDKVWVLKRYDRQGKRMDMEQRIKGMFQIEAERKAYSRIAAVPCHEKAGVDFLMWMGASLTIDKQMGLLMPKMASDLGKWLKVVHTPLREDSRRIMAQCIVGLATLHSIGIIHADIKPGNIFLDARMNVKIGDFGLSQTSVKQRPLKAAVGYGRENAGTEGYMAPEVVTQPRRYSYQVDYWSLGVVFLEMLVGHNKFLDTLSEELMPAWAKRNKYLSKRTQYCLRRSSSLEAPELEVLCGLLDPCPQNRMGIEQLLMHRYFEVDGVSEFEGIREKALLRPLDDVSGSERVCKWPYVCISTHSDVPGPWEWLNPNLYKAA